MPSNLTKEMQYLTALPIAELLRELDRCRDRVLERLEAAASGAAASPVAAPAAEEAKPQAASAVSASARPPESAAPAATAAVAGDPASGPVPPPATSAAIAPAPPPAAPEPEPTEVLLMEVSPETLNGLAASIRTVTTPAGVLLQALKDCVPGKSPGDFAVTVDKEPITAQDLIDMVGTGDIRRTEPTSMAVEDLKELLVGSPAG